MTAIFALRDQRMTDNLFVTKPPYPMPRRGAKAGGVLILVLRPLSPQVDILQSLASVLSAALLYSGIVMFCGRKQPFGLRTTGEILRYVFDVFSLPRATGSARRFTVTVG